MGTLSCYRIRWIWLLLLFLNKCLATATDSIRLRSVRKPSQNEAIYFGLGLLNPYINYTDNEKRGGVVTGNNYYMGDSMTHIETFSKKGLDSNSQYRSKVTAYKGKGVTSEKGTYTFELNKQGKAKFNKSRIELKCQHVYIPFRKTQSRFSTFTIGKDLVCDIPAEPMQCLRLPASKCPQMVRKGNSLFLDLNVTSLRMFNLELGLVDGDDIGLTLQEMDIAVPFTEKVCSTFYKFKAVRSNDTDPLRLSFEADRHKDNNTKTPQIRYIKYSNRNCNTSCGTKPVCPEEPGGEFRDFAKYISNETNPEKTNVSTTNNVPKNDFGGNDEFKKAYTERSRKIRKKTKADLEKDSLEKELAESKLLEKDLLHLSNPQMLLNKIKSPTKKDKHRKTKTTKTTKTPHKKEKTLQNEAMENEVFQKEIKHNQSLERQLSHMSELDRNSSNAIQHSKAASKLEENIAVSSKQLHNEQLEKESLERELLDSKLLETDILHLTMAQDFPNHHNMIVKAMKNRDDGGSNRKDKRKKKDKSKGNLKNDVMERNALEKALKQNEFLEKEVLHMGEEEHQHQQKIIHNGSVKVMKNKDGSIKPASENELKEPSVALQKQVLDSSLLEKDVKTIKMPDAQITLCNTIRNMKTKPNMQMAHEKEAVDSDVIEKEALDRELKESELLEREVQHMRITVPGNKNLFKGTGGEIDRESGEEGGSTLVESTITTLGSGGVFDQQGIHEKVNIVRELPSEASSYSGNSETSGGNYQHFGHINFKDYIIGEAASGSGDEESGAAGDEVSTAANMLSEEDKLKRIRLVMKLKKAEKVEKAGNVGGINVAVGKGGSSETVQAVQVSDANEIAGSEPPLKEPAAEVPGKEVLQKKGRVPQKRPFKKHKDKTTKY